MTEYSTCMILIGWLIDWLRHFYIIHIYRLEFDLNSYIQTWVWSQPVTNLSGFQVCAAGSRSASSADLRDGRGVLGSELRITIWILYVFEVISILSTGMCRVITTTVHEHVFATNTPSKLAYFYHVFLGNTEWPYIFRSFCSHELKWVGCPKRLWTSKHHPSQVGEKFVTPPPFDIAGSCLVNERNALNASSQWEYWSQRRIQIIWSQCMEQGILYLIQLFELFNAIYWYFKI